MDEFNPSDQPYEINPDELGMPPYPVKLTHPVALYGMLVDLYAWVNEARDVVNNVAAFYEAPESPYLEQLGPPPTAHTGSSAFDEPFRQGDYQRFAKTGVSEMYMYWVSLREIRERFDSISREHETMWGKKAHWIHLCNLFRVASMLLSIVFLDNEKREAKLEQMKSERFKQIKGIIQNFSKHVSFEDNEQEIDFDALFNPPEEDE